MEREPVVQESANEWETWADEDVAQRGLVYWKTLVSGDLTHSDTLTMGIAKIPPAGVLREHRHRQVEFYLVLEGTGLVRIDGKTRPVGLVGSAARIRFCCELLRRGRVRLRRVSLNRCLDGQP